MPFQYFFVRTVDFFACVLRVLVETLDATTLVSSLSHRIIKRLANALIRLHLSAD